VIRYCKLQFRQLLLLAAMGFEDQGTAAFQARKSQRKKSEIADEKCSLHPLNGTWLFVSNMYI
jgi:uncharacterized protein YchJ